jgi:hypothetical protein
LAAIHNDISAYIGLSRLMEINELFKTFSIQYVRRVTDALFLGIKKSFFGNYPNNAAWE